MSAAAGAAQDTLGATGAPAATSPGGPLDEWVAAGPWPQRIGTRVLLELARRPRGGALLRRLGPVGQLAGSMVALGRYDDPARSRALGWDPDAVVARGCAPPRDGSDDRPRTARRSGAVSGARRLAADVCVVGAGAGGAVVAAELAEAGARVVLLEQGPRHDADGFTARPPQMLARLYRDGGQTLTAGNPPVGLPLGRGIGGTTLVNSGTCFRTPEAVLQRWQREHGLELAGGALDPCFERVERALSVAKVTPALAGRNAEVARRGAERLGWSHDYISRNARGCVGSGVCAYGCPASAKQHVGIVYVPRAEAAGAEVVTGADVRSVRVARGRVRGVEGAVAGQHGRPRRRLVVDAPTVVLAAGTVGTPLLLERSELGRGSGQLGRNLSLHPATAAFARMDEVVDMGHGVPQSLYVDEFAAEGIMFEGIAGPPAHAALALPLTGRRHAEAMADYRRLAQFGLMVSDSSRGRVRMVGGRPLIRYDLCDADLRRFRRGLALLRELFVAAGAREVHLPLPEGVEPERARRRDLKLMAFHPLGTARADARPSHGVVDGDLAVHGVEGLHVADGSVVPSSLGVNPQITIMALATRLAFGLLGEPVVTAAVAAAARDRAED